MRIVVTAGPTIEPIDAVRFISNFSSGRTGYAVAAAAAGRGHEVTLISGPVRLHPPAGVRTVEVAATAEMERALREEFPAADALVMAAAVCDYRPRRVFEGKLDRSPAGLTLELEPTPDILAELAAEKGGRVVMGFALEAEDGIAAALRKCREKNCDVVALNPPASLNGGDTEITLVYPDGRVKPLPLLPKEAAAELIVAELERLARGRG